jgi:hypothetical protein
MSGLKEDALAVWIITQLFKQEKKRTDEKLNKREKIHSFS